MEAAVRRAPDPLEFFAAVARAPYAHDFYHALRRVECLFADKPRLGTAPRIVDEPVRLGQEPALDFAPAALSALRVPAAGGAPRLEVRFLGLLGPNGALPLHLTDYARERLIHAGDATFARFLDVLNHRFLALFYRAWAQAQPTVQLDRPAQDRFAIYIGAVEGLAPPALRGRDALPDEAKRFFAGWLGRQVRNRDGLVALLAGYLRVPVQVEEFVGHWMEVPADDRARLGSLARDATLGRGAVVGRAVWDRQHRIRIRLGPLTLARYEGFLPGARGLERLVASVLTYLGWEFRWDVRLCLRRAEVPRARLGSYGRLGWTTWLGTWGRDEDAADLVLDPEIQRTVQPPREEAA